ncbi:MAG: ClpXP protease specificity-enhancing factor [Gammaproteobacteria bacterium]
MISTRPYLIRAIYEWAQDNNLTPHILVDTSVDGVSVPVERIEDDKIIFNIAASAVANLSLDDDYISFNARFDGVDRKIFVPVSAVRAVYARENGMGVVLPDDPDQDEAQVTQDGSVADANVPKGSHLKIIK